MVIVPSAAVSSAAVSLLVADMVSFGVRGETARVTKARPFIKHDVSNGVAHASGSSRIRTTQRHVYKQTRLFQAKQRMLAQRARRHSNGALVRLLDLTGATNMRWRH